MRGVYGRGALMTTRDPPIVQFITRLRETCNSFFPNAYTVRNTAANNKTQLALSQNNSIIHRVIATQFRSISMPSGFHRHFVGKTLRNVRYSDVTEIRFVGRLMLAPTFS